MSNISAKTNPYIDEKELWGFIDESKSFSVDKVLDKAIDGKGLSLLDAACLINIDNNDSETLNKLFKAAKKVKELIYGTRIVLFAPLYLSNYCTNNCLYCGFRYDNKELPRMKLTVEEAVNDAKNLMSQGHKRLLLVAGEDVQKVKLDYIGEVIEKIYATKEGHGEIRRININIAPLSVEDFKLLKSFNIGTYQSFQETYHYETYKNMHPSGPKANYAWRYETMARAFEAGFDDVGMGALFGLTDYRFEMLAMLQHSMKLDEQFGVGPHTLSIPRLEPAKGSSFSTESPYAVDDISFKKIVATLRLTLPYTGIILSTRERAEFRREVIALGVSQISAGSKTNPGGYSKCQEDASGEQFALGDHRPLDEVIYELCQDNYIPSFCTGCYRLGRVGHDFMDLAKPGLIQKFCQPNALFTFKEYLMDYASPETREAGLKSIDDNLEMIQDQELKQKVSSNLDLIREGERDIYF